MRITVVTVCLNSAKVIEPTLQSVLTQDYPDLEYLVADGGSTDGTLDIARRHAGDRAKLVSEPDRGVYDAMNKAVRRASGEYLLFMNAGDVFARNDVLSRAAAASAGADVVYGDFSYSEGPRKGRVHADMQRGVFNHQSVLYRRKLHERFGGYFAVRGLTAADYLFFMHLQAAGASFCKLDMVFSVVDPHGMSSGLQTFLQVSLVDGLLARRGRYATAFRIAAHPLFHFLRQLTGWRR